MSEKPHIKLTDGLPSVTMGDKTFISDSLTNVMSGLNTGSDPRTYNQFNFFNHGTMDYLWTNPHQLYSAYRSSWLARQIVNIPAKDAMREWRNFTCKDSETIEKAEKKLNISSKFTELASLARLSGGAIMVMMIEGQDLAEPLDLNKVTKGSLKAVQVFDRYELSWSQQNITDPLKDNFLLPEYYMIAGGENSMIHHSNCILMTGAELPRLLKRMEGGGWGDSSLRQCMEDLTDVVASRAGVAALLQKANVDAIKTAGLKNARTTEQEEAVIKRLQLFKVGMSNHNLAILDDTEDLIRMGAQFGGTSEALNQLMIWISGAADIPMTRLFGVQSKGLGDTGGGDQKNYFDSLRSEQEAKYRLALEQLDEVMVRSALGEYPEDCEFEWNPLYQESGLEMAQQKLATTQADMLDLEAGVVTVSQLQLKRQTEDEYFYDDDDIKKLQNYEKEQLEVRTNGKSEPDFFGVSNGDEPGANEEEKSESGETI
ncbi:portal protein [Vibrio phage 209E38-1]